MSLTGSCHCGNVAFEADMELPASVTRCTCTFCTKRGALHVYMEPAKFRLTTPDPALGTYRWNTRRAAHHFCPRCGCPTHSDTPAFAQDGSWDGITRRISVNARLFDGFDAATAPVTVIDGRNLW